MVFPDRLLPHVSVAPRVTWMGGKATHGWHARLGTGEERGTVINAMEGNELDLLLRGLESLRAHLGSGWVDREVDAAVALLQSDTSGGRGPRRRFHPVVDLFA